jgi:hypothetical protein
MVQTKSDDVFTIHRQCLLFGERWPDKNAGQRWHVRGSSFLSSFFAYFFSNGKSMKKKRRMIDFKNKNIIFD